MRDLGIIAGVLTVAALLADLADRENWLGDQPGLVVILFLAAALLVAGACAERRTPPGPR